MKKTLRALALALSLAVGGTVLAAAPAHAGITAPRNADHVTFYNCKGPYWISGQPYYLCYADWDWYAEFFWGARDGMVYAKAWWTA